METAFYISAVVAVAATILAITRVNVVHALLYLIVSLLSVALIFFLLGAPFIAALEVIIYAGAIMVLFLFAIMMLNLGPQSHRQERHLLSPGIWMGPSLLSAVLIGELFFVLSRGGAALTSGAVGPKETGIALFGPYLLGAELASVLLLTGLIGAYHLGRRDRREERGDL
jgi:NADH-quinone oxidoreductase subunit J